MLLTTAEVLNKPSIKKYYGQKLLGDYPTELIEYEQSILISNITKIQSIWPYLSIDLIRNNIDFLEIVDLPLKKTHTDWILQNIKIESFLNMIGTHYRKIGCIEIGTFIRDTFDQLEKLLNRNISITPPKRWRLIELHDHISYLYLKNTTKNSVLKTVIKPYRSGEYVLSQPKDTLEIVIWGKKVKNCVASYEERIGKSIWIFFIEKDGIPYLTIETDMKDYHIKQIVTQCNGSVSDSDRSMAQNMIREATKK